MPIESIRLAECGATLQLFKNENLVRNILPAYVPLCVKAIISNLFYTLNAK